jgi:hypothetical protein
MNKYGTHLPILLKVVEATKGDVLEMGIGSSSTPALHKVCTEQGRRLDSYDNDPDYVQEYSRRFRHPLHSFFWISNWDAASIDKPWSVVLIDHKPAIRRRRDAVRLADHADYIVVHDTEPEIDRFYRFQSIFSRFKYTFHDEQIPRTTVLSNKCELDWLK